MATDTSLSLEHCDFERGLVVRRGPAYLMSGAGPGGWVGEAFHAFARREVVAVARAEQAGPDAANQLSENLRQASEGMLAGAGGWTRGSSLELRYVTEPEPGRPTRVRLFLTAKAVGHDPQAAAGEADAAVERACAALPTTHRWEPAAPGLESLPNPSTLTTVEVRKQEELLRPVLEAVPTDYYYVAYPLAGDGAGWSQFGRALARINQPVVVSLLFSPTALSGEESTAIGVVTSQLEFHGTARQEYDVLGNPYSMPADASAAAALPIWRNYQSALAHCVLARATVSGPPEGALAIAKELVAAVSVRRQETGGTAPTTQRPSDDESAWKQWHSFSLLDVVPWGGHSVWDRPDAPLTLRRLPYLYSVREASVLAILPVPDADGVAGFPLAKPTRAARIRDSDASEPGVVLGHFEHHGVGAGGEAVVPLTAINRHVLVVGAPGAGKTTTVLSMLARLWREHKIPFLAIEPTKTEYRGLLSVPGMEELRVITLGRDDIAPIRLNPLAPPNGVRCETHLNAVMSTFRAALPLDPPLPQLLEDALERCYEHAGWDYDTTSDAGLPAPTLRDLLDTYESGFGAHGYAGEVKANLLAALRLRLRSLTRGTRGLLLDTVESVDFDDLMHRPVVIELDEISDREDKAVLSAFILDRIRAAARARKSTGGQLRHITVLEEAHRLLARIGGSDGETPQAAAIRSFCDAIAELRALGEGFVVCSQSPSALADAAVANTGTRIVHRLESSADRELVLADLDATESERAAAARLERGQVVVRWEALGELEFVRVLSADGVDSGRPVSDAEVRERMATENETVHRLMPYRLCTHAVCHSGCDPVVRARGRMLARSAGQEARSIWEKHDGSPDALGPIAKILAASAEGDTQLAYCAAAHLAIHGDAFDVGPRDIRSVLAAGVSKAVEEQNER